MHGIWTENIDIAYVLSGRWVINQHFRACRYLYLSIYFTCLIEGKDYDITLKLLTKQIAQYDFLQDQK